jgi:hypothetical protein
MGGTPLAPRVLAPPLFEGDDLGRASLVDDFGGHLSSRHAGAANLRRLPAQHEHVGKLDGRTGLTGHLFDGQNIVGRDAVLLAAGLDDSVHL